MPGTGQLLRSVGMGGGGALAAARELVRRAQAGTVSRAELQAVQQLLQRPGLDDGFHEVARDVEALLGAGRPQVFRDVNALTPQREKLTDAAALPARFLTDLAVVNPQLLEHPGLSGDQKAERLFAFFEAYAERFVELAHGPEGGGLTGAALEKALAKFDRALTRAGFEALRTDDGRTGLTAAQQMLRAPSADAQSQLRPSRLQAPEWKDNAAAPRRAEVEPGAVPLQAPAQAQPLARKAPTVAPGDDARQGKGARSRGRDGVLGPRMLWNVLHLLRGEDLDEAARKEAWSQLVISALLVLALGGILVGVAAAM